jgi:beta-barrel assembly-enhancing protease
MKRSALAKYVALCLVVLLLGPQYLLAAVATERPTLPDPGHTRYSKEQQEQIGQKFKAEVYKQMPILPNSSPVTQYVQQLGRKLEAVIPPQYNWPYEFHVVQQKDINAFALPGGPIFVNLGTILAAKDEAQLAGVMAHEMSHVYMQHSIKGAEQQQKTGLLAGLAGIAGAMVGLGGLAQAAAGTIGGLYSLHYSRGDEAQADHVGAIIMYLAGYNPVEMADFFRQLETQAGTPPQFLSDHPNPGNRVTAVQDEIKNWAPEDFNTDNSRFERAKAEAQNAKSYSAQQIAQMGKSGQIHNQEGSDSQTDSDSDNQTDSDSDNQTDSDNRPPILARKGGPSSSSSSGVHPAVTPSGDMRTYDNNLFTISHPSNWQVTNGGGGDIMITPPSGVTQGEIAYGALINQARSSGDLDKDIKRLAAAMGRDNPNLRTAGSPQAITINGRQGRSQDFIGTSPIENDGHPEQERDRLVIVPTNNGNLLYVVFVAPEPDYTKLEGTYQTMLRSLQVR